MEQVAPWYADDWWFAGDLAFEYADTLGEGGHHSTVVAFLEGWLPGYPAGAPEFSHLAWHLGMSEARLSHPERALRVYRQRLDPARVPGTRLRDAAGLLWHLHLRLGGNRRAGALPWKPVADLASGLVRGANVAGAIDDLDAVFAAMAFAAAGDAAEAERLVGVLHRHACQGNAVTETVTLPLVRGVLAFGAGEYRSAERLMASAGAGGLIRLGASNGQAANVLATLHEARRQRPRCEPSPRCRFGPPPSRPPTRRAARSRRRDSQTCGPPAAAPGRPPRRRRACPCARRSR
jgi:hypothetical protein